MTRDTSGGGIDQGASFESVRIIRPPTPPAADPDDVVDDDAPAWMELAPSLSLGDEEVGDALELKEGQEFDPTATAEVHIASVGPNRLEPTTDPTQSEVTPIAVTAVPPKPRTVIVIDDGAPFPGQPNDLGLGADLTSGERVDPRIRARRREVKRAAGLRRFRVLIGIVVVLVLLATASLVSQSSLFAVKEVRVTGVHYTDAAAVQAIADELNGQPLYRVDVAKVQEEILVQPWVRRVHVTQIWPRTITIDIAERTPVATVQTDDEQWRIIDTDGRVLAVTLGQPKDYIVIQPAGGSAQMPSVPLGEIVPSPIVAGVQLAEMLPGRLKSITSKVIVGGDGAVALDISPKGRILLGTVNELRAKLISVLTYMDACPGVQFELMDARAADSLTVTPPSCLKSPLTQKVP